MRNFFTLLFILSNIVVHSQDRVNKISGVVTSYGSPMANVNIALKGSSDGIQTDANGKYEIDARPRDILIFSYVGMTTQEIIIEDVTRVLNIDMIPRVEELDEVIVQQKAKKGQQGLAMGYAKKKSIISTAYGFVDAANAGYAMSHIDGADLNPSAIDIISAIQGKIPGLSVETIDDNGVALRALFMRGRSSANTPRPAIYEVDGVIFEKAPDFLQIDRIDRVATIPGLAGVIKYGQIAAGGIIVINTIGANVQREEGTNKPYDQVKLRDNTFDARSVQGRFKREPPKYILEMKKETTAEDAMAQFDIQKKLYGSSPYFYLSAADFFQENWASSNMQDLVIMEMKAKYSNNSNVLKALAYTYEERKNFDAALKSYIEIFKKRPRYAQSYRDLANMYSKTGNYKKALALYVRYQKSRSLDTVTTGFEGIDAVIDTEFTNLLATHGKELAKGAKNGEMTEYQGIRTVFEWNNSEAEFDLQFVNPEKTYFIWSHTNEKEKARIIDEKTKGYTSEQFLIDQSKPGEWLINLKYYGNKSYDPTIMKVTTYYNYGLFTQRSEIKVFRLELKNVNQQLVMLQNK